MKQTLVILLCLCWLGTFAQQERKYVRLGNELYKAGKTQLAGEMYAIAVTKNNKSPEATFDLGSVLLKMDSLDKAAAVFNAAAQLTTDPLIKAKAYHNEGNAYMKAKKYEDAVTAYKNALKNNPKDEDTRYNLAYAQEMLKKDQQNQKNDKNQQNKDKDKDKNDKSNGQDGKNQDKNTKDSKNGQDSKGSKDAKDGKNGQDQDAKKDDKKDGKDEMAQPKEGKLSKEQAERLLQALKNEEQKVQQKLQLKKVKAPNKKIEKDW